MSAPKRDSYLFSKESQRPSRLSRVSSPFGAGTFTSCTCLPYCMSTERTRSISSPATPQDSRVRVAFASRSEKWRLTRSASAGARMMSVTAKTCL